MRLNRSVEGVAVSPISEAYGCLGERPAPLGPGSGAETEIIDVSQAVPGYPPPESLRRHVAERALDPETHRYTDQLGLPALRAALASDLERAYGGRVDARQVAIAAGCNQAFCLVADALAGAGDEVILPLPFYFNHDMWLRARGGADLPPRRRGPSAAAGRDRPSDHAPDARDRAGDPEQPDRRGLPPS